VSAVNRIALGGTAAQAPVEMPAPAPPPSQPGSRRAPRWLGGVLPMGFLLLLELAVRLGAVPAHLLPPPSEVGRTLVALSGNGLATHIVASTARVFGGFAIASVLAVALGALVGLNRRAEALLDPSFQALRAIPSLAWVPLLLLWLGIDESSKVTLIAIGAFFPIYMGVVSGLRDVDRKLVEVAELAGLKPIAMVRRVLLPAAAPAVLTGLRNGLSLAWMFMVAAELIAATRGLGYLLSDGRETGRADIVLAVIALLAVLGKLTDSGMRWLEGHLLAWRDTLDTRAP
jgi:sulfonate transport system permease protein